MNIQYVGEHLLPGELGHVLVILSFASAVVSSFAFVFATNKRDLPEAASWRNIGKISWYIHFLSILATIGVVYWLIFNQQFEYDYVRRNTAPGMPLPYLISSFWAQQQGSFMLWLFWHAVMGSVVLLTVKARWSSPALAVFSLVQVVIVSMILGVFVERGIAIAILLLALNIPFWILLRNAGEKGWKSLVPIWNVVTAWRAANLSHLRHPELLHPRHPELVSGSPDPPKLLKQVQHDDDKSTASPTWLLILLALPLNLVLFVWLPLNWNDAREFLTESIALGVSPFELSRERFASSAVFLNADYLTMISGQGLNPLLQNYWMVIHPPTLFLGFASTLVPFSLAIAALWLKDFKNWWKPALPFTVFSTMILGTGIMMGGIWAYEALSFGGFWAWDPVENASLVPWLTLLAGLHTLVIYKSTGRALRITFIFFIVTTFLVLYSTFLTRSGILGDTSVHAFTDLGMMGQLIVLILAIIFPAVVMLTVAWYRLPKQAEEESAWSREFWMFVASIVLAIAALHITISTSLPVINSIFGTQLAAPEDAEGYYNSVQVWIGILIALMSGWGLYFRFKKTPLSGLKQLIPHALVALAGVVIIGLLIRVEEVSYYILVFSGLFGASANLWYLTKSLRRKFKLSGAAISHLGFGITMVGLVVALANSRTISKNVSGVTYSTEAPDDFNRYNVRLNRGQTVPMGDYHITYIGREQDSINYYYRVLYERFDENTGEIAETFELRPHVMDHPSMGEVANPATKHYLKKDIFTHVTSIPRNSLIRSIDEPVVESHTIMEGDSFWTSSGLVVFEGFTPLSQDNDLTVIANLRLRTLDGTHELKPVYALRDSRVQVTEAHMEPLDPGSPAGGFSVALTSIEPGKGFTFRTFEVVDWIIMKAIVFPFINLLWLGIALAVLGMLIVLRKRIKEYKRTSRSL